MRRFSCPDCTNEVHFDSATCLVCGTALVYDPNSELFVPLSAPPEPTNACVNREWIACNWAAEATGPYCVACLHNRTVPDVTIEEHRANWRWIEQAKRILFYTILKWQLPHPYRNEADETGLAFDFLADHVDDEGELVTVLSGHADGIITLNIAEGDDAERETRRTQMREPYRTLIGHLRHESGHYFWNLLVRDGGRLDSFRAAFGDEREDYGEALERHYANGPQANWNNQFVSAYASAHAWEDFAESFAHYLHIVDALETAHAFGLELSPTFPPADDRLAFNFDAYHVEDWQTLIKAWIPLTVAINALNRSLGQPDLYPFALSSPATDKLRFIHDLLNQSTPAKA